MGCFCSCVSLSSAKSSSFDCVRVVHLNGFVEDFAGPVVVREVAGLESKQFICSPAQLRSFDPHPLSPDALLQPGELYFMLPFSALQSDTSPLNLAALVARLTAAANRATNTGSSRMQFSSIWDCNRAYTSINQQESDSGQTQFSSLWDHTRAYSNINHQVSDSEGTNLALTSIGSRVRSWKPILETIQESSFRRLEP